MLHEQCETAWLLPGVKRTAIDFSR